MTYPKPGILGVIITVTCVSPLLYIFDNNRRLKCYEKKRNPYPKIRYYIIYYYYSSPQIVCLFLSS